MSRVYEYTDSTLTKSKIYDRLKQFVFKTYNNGAQTKINEDAVNGKLIMNAQTKDVVFHSAMNKCKGGYFTYLMTLYAKDKKAKVVIENITHYRGECPYEAKDGSDFGDDFPNKWGRIAKKYDAKQFQELKAQAFEEFKLILDYLEKFTSNKKDDGDF